MEGSFGWLFAVTALLLLLGWYLSFSAARLDRLHTRVEAAGAALDAELVRRSAAALEATQALDGSGAALVADAAVEAMAVGERGCPLAGREEVENQLSRALQIAFASPSTPFTASPPSPGAEVAPEEVAPEEVPAEVAPEEVPAEAAVETAVDARGLAPVEVHRGQAPVEVADTAGSDVPAEGRISPRLARIEPSGGEWDGLAKACERVQLARRFHNDAVAQAQRVRRKRVVRWARLAGRAAMPQMFEIDDCPPPALVR